MSDQQTSKSSKKSVTPPKGRPTRSRDGVVGKRRVFGPTAQWIAVAFLMALIFLMIVVLLDGGDFNPFGGSDSGL